MNIKRIFALFAVTLALCTLMSFVACDSTEHGTDTETTTQATTQAPAQNGTTQAPTAEQTTQADDGKVTYTVKVVDANGTPVAGVAVQFCDDNGCRMPVPTNAEGIVTLTDEESDFHVTLASVPAGYAADANEYYFDGKTELTVTLQAE